MASRTPILASSLRVLGGSDSAAPRALPAALASTRTEWPHCASRHAMADPAGPPPITTMSTFALTVSGDYWAFAADCRGHFQRDGAVEAAVTKSRQRRISGRRPQTTPASDKAYPAGVSGQSASECHPRVGSLGTR